jgi:hypothetical protein
MHSNSPLALVMDDFRASNSVANPSSKVFDLGIAEWLDYAYILYPRFIYICFFVYYIIDLRKVHVDRTSQQGKKFLEVKVRSQGSAIPNFGMPCHDFRKLRRTIRDLV